jgi:hypothetical protein
MHKIIFCLSPGNPLIGEKAKTLVEILAANQPVNIITGDKEKQLPPHDLFPNSALSFKMQLCLF